MVKKYEEIAVALQPNDASAASPFPGLSFAGEMDDVLEQPMEISMNATWNGYLNGRVLSEFNLRYPGRLTFLRFLPDIDNGMVIMVPAKDESEYGATPIEYSATENGAEVNLRRAVKRLKVTPQADRVHIFPVVIRKAPNGEEFLAFVTKGATTRPARKLKKSEQQGTPAPQGGTEQKQG